MGEGWGIEGVGKGEGLGRGWGGRGEGFPPTCQELGSPRKDKTPPRGSLMEPPKEEDKGATRKKEGPDHEPLDPSEWC